MQPAQRRQQPYQVARAPTAPRTFPTARREQPQPQPQPKIAQPAKQSPQPRQESNPQANTVHVDPTQQWLIAANAGSFSSSGDEPEGEEPKVTGIEGGTGAAMQVAQNTTTDYNAKRVLVGTIAEGRLETPLAWVAGEESSQNYLVKLTKPLNSKPKSF